MNIWQFCDKNPFLALALFFLAACAAEAPFKFGFRAWKMSCRSRNIAAQGWPPAHLDADGDFRPETDDD